MLLRDTVKRGDNMTFAEYIYSHGYTVRSLAKKAGVNHRTLEGYSSRRFPWANSRLWFAQKVANALEISTNDLLNFDP